MMRYCTIGMFLLLLACTAHAQQSVTPNPSYTVSGIPVPPGLAAKTGGIDFLPGGRLVACFQRGEVMIYNTQMKTWSTFAGGLQSPMGIVALSDTQVLVMQLAELTRITDTDHDGVADLYENVANEFGVSGNYHEFNYGPVKDAAGNLFFSLNTGSSGGGVRAEVMGTVNPHGRDGDDGQKQMFSVVPNRGWVMQVNPAGKLVPYASGFRSPNGLGFDLSGNLFVTDNQSDWVETSTLYHVREGHFYGHPASLVWKDAWKDKDPFHAPVPSLDSMRTRAAVLFPQGIMANSPAQPLADGTKGRFGPFAGQLFVGEMNRDRIVRVMLEKIGGEWQGACMPFMDGHGLHKGNNRLAFAPDGSLWIGQMAYGGWVGDTGIQRIVFTGEPPMDLLTMKLTRKGFELTFTQPIDAAGASNPANFVLRHYRYDYKKKPPDEGIDHSTQADLQEVTVTRVRLSRDHKKVTLELPALKAGYVYELKLGAIKNKSGRPLDNRLVCYTLNKLLP